MSGNETSVSNILKTTPATFYENATNHTIPSSLISWEWGWDRTVKALIFSPILLFTILGNFLVLYAFITRSRFLRAPIHYFIANLALADFLVGLLCMPFLAVTSVTDRWYFGPDMCLLWTITHVWLCATSILSTLGVCVERYIGVRFPINHLQLLSSPRLHGIMAFIWIFSGSLTLCSVFIWPQPYVNDDRQECRGNQQLGHVLVVVVGTLYIPMSLMIIFYWNIYAIAVTHLQKMSSKQERRTLFFRDSFINQTELGSNSTCVDIANYDHSEINKGEDEFAKTKEPISPKEKLEFFNDYETKEKAKYSQKQINLAQKLALPVAILLISYFPFFTMKLVKVLSPGLIPGEVFMAFGWIRYFNSCINPVIYAFSVPAYKKAIKNILFTKGRN